MPAALRAFLREFYICWRFIRGDITTTIIPGTLFGSAALLYKQLNLPTDVLAVLAKQITLFWLYIYTFCLANQLTGVEEDRINKPDRPLPAGLLSEGEARARLVVYTALYLMLSHHLGVMHWALLWSAITIAHNFLGLDHHWFTKNCVAMSIGSVAGLAAAWEVVAPLSAAVWGWLLAIAAFAGLTFSVQDFRDMEGDRIKKRLTLPLVIGPAPARRLMAGLLFVMPLGIFLCCYLVSHRPAWSAVYAAVLGAQLWLVAIRLLILRRKRDDRRTYTLYTYSYCTMVAGVFLFA